MALIIDTPPSKFSQWINGMAEAMRAPSTVAPATETEEEKRKRLEKEAEFTRMLQQSGFKFGYEGDKKTP